MLRSDILAFWASFQDYKVPRRQANIFRRMSADILGESATDLLWTFLQTASMDVWVEKDEVEQFNVTLDTIRKGPVAY